MKGLKNPQSIETF